MKKYSVSIMIIAFIACHFLFLSDVSAKEPTELGMDSLRFCVVKYYESGKTRPYEYRASDGWGPKQLKFDEYKSGKIPNSVEYVFVSGAEAKTKNDGTTYKLTIPRYAKRNNGTDVPVIGIIDNPYWGIYYTDDNGKKISHTFEILLNEGIVYIGDYSFAWYGIDGRSGSSEVIKDLIGNTYVHNIPKTVKEIGDYAFYCNHTGGDIVFDSGNQDIIFGEGVFQNAMYLDKVVLPNNLEVIPESTFARCGDLKEVVIGDNTKIIGKSAFYNLSYLHSIHLGNGVEEICDEAFAGCSAIQSITIPASVKKIGIGVFDKCICLETVNIECDTVFYQEFKGLKSLKTVNAKYLTKIEEEAFQGATGLTDFIIEKYDENVLEYGIDKNAFSQCGKITWTIGGNGSPSFKGWLYDSIGRYAQAPDVLKDDISTAEAKVFPLFYNVKGKNFGFVDRLFIMSNENNQVEGYIDKNERSIRFSEESLENMRLKKHNPVSGYVFRGWATEETIDNMQGETESLDDYLDRIIVYSDEQVVSFQLGSYEKGKKLYAIFIPISYTVIYNLGDKVSADLAIQRVNYYYYPEEYSRNLPNWEGYRKGYTLIGYSLDEKSSVDVDLSDEGYKKLQKMVSDGMTIEIYAVWKVNQYTVVYSDGGLKNEASAYYDSRYTVPSGLYTKSGYHVAGYDTNPSANNVVYEVNTKTIYNLTDEPNGIVYLYAVWMPNTYTIKFNANGGSGTMLDQSMTYSIRKVLFANEFSRNGYYFKGWATYSSASSISYSDEQSVYNLSDIDNDVVTLYAVWAVCKHSTTNTVDYIAATCTANGYTGDTVCSKCGKVINYGTTIPATNHKGTTVVYQAEVEPTCTATGMTAGIRCTKCGVIVQQPTVIAKKAHTKVTDKAVEATCTSTGLTAGSHCSVCGKIIKAQQVVEMKEHTPVTDKAVAATCTSTGLTAGSHCSVCGKIIKAQQVVEKKAHTPVTDKAVESTCTSTGLTEGSHCSVCGEIITPQQVVRKKSHTSVTDKAVESTCTSTGLTEGSHCSVCGKILTRQRTIEKKAHTAVTDAAVAATCTSTGLTEGSHCSVCGTVITRQNTVPKLDHTAVTDLGYAATHTQKGLSNGSHCAVCGEVITEQTVIPVIENPFKDVGKGKYYMESVLYLLDKNVMTGFNAETFGVGSNLTREDMVTLLWKSEGKPDMKVKEKPFPDIALGKYYTNAVAWAKQNKIVGGYATGYFGQGDDITRQDFIKIIYGFAKYKGYDTSVVSSKTYLEKADANDVSSYARESMNWGYEKGLIGQGSDLRPKENITRQDAAMIIARFLKKFEKETYEIRFNVNGGKNAPAALIIKQDEIINLPDTIPVREGYEFLGWAESFKTTRVKYAPGAEITGNKRLTLYALWKKKETVFQTYTIRFDANGGVYVSQTIKKKTGEAVNIPELKPSRDGYEFAGWSEDITAISGKYKPGDFFTEDKNVTLYAIWVVKNYRIGFDANGGTAALDELVKKHGEAVTLPLIKPQRSSYNFLGWMDSAEYSQGVKLYNPGDSFEMNKDTTLYAYWLPKYAGAFHYEITFSGNPGDRVSASMVAHRYSVSDDVVSDMGEMWLNTIINDEIGIDGTLYAESEMIITEDNQWLSTFIEPFENYEKAIKLWTSNISIASFEVVWDY